MRDRTNYNAVVNSMNDIERESVTGGSWHNRDQITPGSVCGCFHCQAIFRGDNVRRWVDEGLTALCPRCGIDAVMPGATDQAALKALHDRAFRDSPAPSAAEWNAETSTPRR